MSDYLLVLQLFCWSLIGFVFTLWVYNLKEQLQFYGLLALMFVAGHMVTMAAVVWRV